MSLRDDLDLLALEDALARRRAMLRQHSWTARRVADLLGSAVIAQQTAVSAIGEVLELSMSGLTIDPSRPAAALALVGPTGCGKTELARALKDVTTSRSPRVVIHLDMTEYSDQTAISRLVGSNRGYVGYDDTGALLTTQVQANPTAVVIFDEFEKAHPSVHALLLQILGRGALTDGHGRIARFDRCLVVLTSNVGASDPGRTLGFSNANSGHDTATRQRQHVEAFRRLVAPEFFGRLHAVVAFDPLDHAAMCAIARHHVDRWAQRLEPKGWHVQVGDDVVDFVARRVDNRYGARSLLSALEDRVIRPLVGARPSAMRASMTDEEVMWTPIERR